MPPAVDRRNVKRIGEPVERERAGERDHMAAVDQAAAEAALRRRMLVEVDARGVLIESRCNLVLGLFHGYAVGMVDLLAEHDVEDEEIIDRRARIADRTREDIRGLHGKTRTEQAIVERDVPDRDGARNGMLDHLADVKVFEKVAVAGLRHISTRSFFGRTDRAVFGEPLFIWLGCGVLQEPRMRALAA